jgi:acyl-CoA synthetase (AMP-forming)/AMP-acid ligase II
VTVSSSSSSLAPLAPNPERTAHELLRWAADEYPDRDAYVDAEGEHLTFAQWERAADGTAFALSELGVRAGDVVALILPSCIDYAICFQAAMRLGAITSGINPRLGSAEVASILERSEPRVVISEDDRPVPEGPFRVLARSELRALRSLDRPSGLPTPDIDRPLAVVWTSGTTGVPKGAIFDHRNLAAVSAGAGPLRGPFDCRIAPTPFAHVGYMVHLSEEIAYAITTVIPPTPWKADAVLALMSREKVTVGQGVPSQWRLLLDRSEFDDTDLSALRICGTGGAPVPPSLIREMKERLGCPVVIGYTSTEAALTTGSLPEDEPELIARTVGRARENVEVRVVSDEGQILAPTEFGNIQCSSPAAMRGYWRDPATTRVVISEDGWLDTGDLGSLDANGYLTLGGRRNEMYLRGSYKIYPVEVERVISELPSVAQVAIVAKSDPVLGDIGVAFIVATPNEPPPTLVAVREWAQRSIADYKAPDIVEIIGAMPLTSVGKVDKRVLTERARDLTRPS